MREVHVDGPVQRKGERRILVCLREWENGCVESGGGGNESIEEFVGVAYSLNATQAAGVSVSKE